MRVKKNLFCLLSLQCTNSSEWVTTSCWNLLSTHSNTRWSCGLHFLKKILQAGLGSWAAIVLGCCLYHRPGISHVSPQDRTPDFANLLSSPAWFSAFLPVFSSSLVKDKGYIVRVNMYILILYWWFVFNILGLVEYYTEPWEGMNYWFM